MREISIDVTRMVLRGLRGRLPTGIDRVCQAYIAHYPEARAVLRRGRFVRSLSSSGSAELLQILGQWGEGTPGALRKSLVKAVLAVRGTKLSPGGIFLNVGHSGLENDRYAAWVKEHRLRAVYMVHDLIPISHPEYCRAGEKERHERRARNMLHSAAGIIANSVQTLNEMAAFGSVSDIPVPTMIAAPLAGARLPAGSPVRPIEAPYFLMVSTIEPRKNHAMVLQVWRRLVEQSTDAATTPRLVLVGQRGWECEQVVDLLERCEVTRPYVTILASASDEELATWYRHAQALLMPSFTEGYGLPVVEALAAGTPVLASDIPVFHEIGQSIPEYIDPLDGAAWLNRIAAYGRFDSSEVGAKKAQCRQFQAPTWTTHFQAVDDFLRTLDDQPHA